MIQQACNIILGILFAHTQGNEVTPCDFRMSLTAIPALYAEDYDKPVDVLLSFPQPSIVTSSLTVEYNSTTFLYMAIMNSTNSFITKVIDKQRM